MDSSEKIKKILSESKHIVISTADEKGVPWVTPLAYSTDKDLNLVWMSPKNTRHSNNINARKEIGIVIFSEKEHEEALYIEATAHEIKSEAEMKSGISALRKNSRTKKFAIESTDDVKGSSPWRLYMAKPKNFYLRDQIVVNNKKVTVRKEINL